MKKLFFLLGMLLPILSISQVLLGSTKDELIELTVNHTGITFKGSDYKYMITWDGDGNTILNWVYFCTNGVCDACMAECTYENINYLINQFNKDYVQTGEMSWVSYGDHNIYININKQPQFYSVIYSYNK